MSQFSLGRTDIRNIWYTDNLCKMLFLPDLLLSLSLVIYLFSEIYLRSVHQSSWFVCLFSVLEDENRGNMIVHIVTDKKDETVFHFLTITTSLLVVTHFPKSSISSIHPEKGIYTYVLRCWTGSKLPLLSMPSSAVVKRTGAPLWVSLTSTAGSPNTVRWMYSIYKGQSAQ